MNLAVVIKTMILLLPLVIMIALIAVGYGFLEFLMTSGDELSKKEGKKKMVIGGVLFAVVAVLWVVAKTAQETLIQ